MANNQYIRLMERLTIKANCAGEGIDLGAFKSLGAQSRVLLSSSVTGGTVAIQHSAVNEQGSYDNLGNTVSLTTETNNIQNHSNFLRWVRWSVENLAGSGAEVVVQIDLVAKEY